MASSSKQEIQSSVAPSPSAIPSELPTSPPLPTNPLIPEALQSLLDWNPPVLRMQKHDKGGSMSKMTGLRRFYDRHLTHDLILKHFQYHPDLAVQIAATVDVAVEAALADGGTLPPPGSKLLDEIDRKEHIAGQSHVMSRELPVTVFYKLVTAQLCIPIASTLALHPKHSRWSNILSWSMVPNAAGFAMADGSLQFLEANPEDESTVEIRAQIYASMGPAMVETIHKLAATYPDLAVWEIKSLTVGDEEVMLGIKRSAMDGRPFNWDTCLCDGALHKMDRMDAVENTRAGPDAPSTPWTLPAIYEEFSQSVYATDDDGGDETDSEGASPPTTADLDKATASISKDAAHSTEGETVTPKDKGKGRARETTPSNTHEMSDRKGSVKRKRDDRYQSKATVTGQSFVQQAWAQAVRTDSTIIILHSGNHEFVCIRHRESQTLYVSDIIHTPTCKAPAYGKLQVGIYIAALQDAILRMEYAESLPEGKRSKLPPNYAKFNKKDGGNDGGKGKDKADGGTGAGDDTKRRKKDGDAPRDKDKGKRGKKQNPKPGRRTRANLKSAREGQDKTVLEANHRDVILVFLRYGVYHSPNPAAFFRKTPAIVRPGQTPTPPPTPKLRKQYAQGTYSTIIITSEIGQGSTGKVHGGIFTLNAPDHYIDLNVAVKLSFDEEEQERLLHEYFMYFHLHSKGVKGIPTVLGLFVDPDNGPSALVLTHGGQSVFDRTSDIEYFQREAFQTTLKAIHAAGILHGDIRSPNLLIDEFGETSIIDFDQAEKNDSEDAQESEFRHLSSVLEGRGR